MISVLYQFLGRLDGSFLVLTPPQFSTGSYVRLPQMAVGNPLFRHKRQTTLARASFRDGFMDKRTTEICWSARKFENSLRFASEAGQGSDTDTEGKYADPLTITVQFAQVRSQVPSGIWSAWARISRPKRIQHTKKPNAKVRLRCSWNTKIKSLDFVTLLFTSLGICSLD